MKQNRCYQMGGDEPGGPRLELVLTGRGELVVSMRGAAGQTLGRFVLGPETGKYYEREILMRLADCTEIGEPPEGCQGCATCDGCKGFKGP